MAGTFEVWDQRNVEDEMLRQRKVALVATALSFLNRDEQESLLKYRVDGADTIVGEAANEKFSRALSLLKSRTGETIY